MMYYFLALIAIAALIYGVAAIRYRKTSYYKATKKLYITVLLDLGSYGEYLTYKCLRKFEKDGAKFIFNCYLPKKDNQTTEVDVMMIYKSGVYVFESKNYSGWIFGSEHSKTWTQTLPSGRKSHKEHFLNPIMQNKLHITWLEKQIGSSYPIHSVIVFSKRCTLKKIEMRSSDIFVVKRDDLPRTVRNIDAKTGAVLQQNIINDLYDKLYSFSQVSEAVKQKHIEDIKKEIQSETTIEDTVTVNEKTIDVVPDENPVNNSVCPKCGGTLVLKTSTKGEYAGKSFYGCSNFPKCRYIKNV